MLQYLHKLKDTMSAIKNLCNGLSRIEVTEVKNQQTHIMDQWK